MRPLRLALAVLIAMAVAGTGGIYGLSEWKLRQRHDAPLVPLRAVGPADLLEGERMALIVGCWNGCHGRKGEGGHWEAPGLLRRTAPNLSQVLPQYNDEELVRLIRYGLKRDGRSAVGMPSSTFWSLGDQDLANIISHLRRQPPTPALADDAEVSWRGRLALITGRWKVSAEQVDRARPRWGEQPRTTASERGRYLADITCNECHGQDFAGSSLERAPSLAIVALYTPEQFVHLIRTAQPPSGRALDEDMQWVVGAPFTKVEIADLYAFLRGHFGLAS